MWIHVIYKTFYATSHVYISSVKYLVDKDFVGSLYNYGNMSTETCYFLKEYSLNYFSKSAFSKS